LILRRSGSPPRSPNLRIEAPPGESGNDATSPPLSSPLSVHGEEKERSDRRVTLAVPGKPKYIKNNFTSRYVSF
jgi:hypothetical protein